MPQVQRRFVPQTLDIGDWTQVEPIAKSLLGREIISADDLEAGQLVKVTFVPDTGRVVQVRFAAKA